MKTKLSFTEWMKQVDAKIEKRVGFGIVSADLPDYCYRDEYDDGTTPAQAASAAIRNAKE